MFDFTSLSAFSKGEIVFMYFITILGMLTIYVSQGSKHDDYVNDSDSEYETSDNIEKASDSEDDIVGQDNISDDIDNTLYGTHGISEEDANEVPSTLDINNQKLISIDTRVLTILKEKIGKGITELIDINDTIINELTRLGLITSKINLELKARDDMGSFSNYSLDDLYNGLKVKKDGVEIEGESRWMALALEEIMRRKALG
jgi:hypothetical protein